MSKVFYKSTTFYALAVAAAAFILTFFGASEEEAHTLAEQLVEVLIPIVGLVATGVAAWGRKRAAGPLTLTETEEEDANDQAG